MTLLKSNNPIEAIADLMGTAGVVGERNNCKCLYGIVITYKSKTPIHFIINGSSGSGKTTLFHVGLGCIPNDKCNIVTRVTDGSLYNFGEYELCNTAFGIEDWDGVEDRAKLALREMASNGKLGSSTTEKTDDGNNEGGIKDVYGPIMLGMATTQGSIYEDNMSRAIVMAVDESKEQTNSIIERQNKKAMGIINDEDEEKAQRMLQVITYLLEPLNVVNPFADKVLLPQKAHKIRRLNELFQLFIKAMCYLNQFQREKDEQGRLIATIDDIENAIHILFECIVLKVDHLDGSLRQFFEDVKSYLVKEHGGISEAMQHLFTQPELCSALAKSKTQINDHLSALVGLEYLQREGHVNKGFKYKIVYWDDYKALRQSIKVHLQTQVDAIRQDYQPKES